jgi:hypothetical protein
MGNSTDDWWDRNLSPGSKRFLAWWCIVAGAMAALFAPFALADRQWLAGSGMGFFGALMIIESVRRLRRIPDDPRP